jgi:hypothetical protein
MKILRKLLGQDRFQDRRKSEKAYESKDAKEDDESDENLFETRP